MIPVFLILQCWLASFREPQFNHAFVIDGRAQGTTYHIKYISADSIVLKSRIDSILRVIDHSLSLYEKNSLINQFNASKSGIIMDAHFENVVDASLKVWQASKGVSDITVKPLVDLWGFGVKGKQPMPDSAQVQMTRKCVGATWLVAKGKQLTKKKACLQIDCNGIAQGYTVDVLAAYLQSQRVQNYIVELGGEIRVKGENEKGEAWTVGIESPSGIDFPEPFERRIAIRSGAITSSGSYRKFYQSGNKLYSHIIDPRTGFPAQSDLVSVSLIAENATTADAYDNVLIVLGLEQSFRFLKKRKDMEAFFIYKKSDGSIADTATAGFYKYMKRD